MFNQVVKSYVVNVKVTGSNPIKTIVYFSILKKGNFVISCKHKQCSSHLIYSVISSIRDDRCMTSKHVASCSAKKMLFNHQNFQENQM